MPGFLKNVGFGWFKAIWGLKRLLRELPLHCSGSLMLLEFRTALESVTAVNGLSVLWL